MAGTDGCSVPPPLHVPLDSLQWWWLQHFALLGGLALVLVAVMAAMVVPHPLPLFFSMACSFACMFELLFYLQVHGELSYRSVLVSGFLSGCQTHAAVFQGAFPDS